MSVLSLGAVELAGFEVPERLEFGGKQQIAVHRLIGGGRVIDTLGPDEGALQWSGVLSGSFAADRAMLLNQMRVAGQVQSLTWNAFCYSVVISHLDFDYRNAWWIPYKIGCAVCEDQSQSGSSFIASLTDLIASDLAAAGSFLGTLDSASVNAAAATVNSSPQSMSAAQTQLTSVQNDILFQAQSAQAGLESPSVSEIVAATGALANLSYARAYLKRSLANLSNESGQ